MPDHFHGIVVLRDNVITDESLKLNNVGNGLKPFPTHIRCHGLSEIIRGFKTFSSRNINLIIRDEYRFRWQKSFHDRVIRNERELSTTREYIINNDPVKSRGAIDTPPKTVYP
jgi:hypothetical protein